MIFQRRNRPTHSPTIHAKCQKRLRNPLYLPTCYDRVVEGVTQIFGNLSAGEIAVGGIIMFWSEARLERPLAPTWIAQKRPNAGSAYAPRSLFQRLRIMMPTFITGTPKALGFRRLFLRDLGEKL
jgi:hypothetical protein